MPAHESVAFRMRSRTWSEFLSSLLFIPVCLALILVPAAFYWRERDFLAHAVKARGVVTKINFVSTSRQTYSCLPEFRFTDAAGQTWTVFGRAPARASCTVGQELAVLYDLRDPSLAQPDDPAAANWQGGSGFAFCGLFLLPFVLHKTVSTAVELVRRRRRFVTRAGP